MPYKTSILRRLKVMHWNCQGITKLSESVQLHLFLKENSVDILMLNETFLKPEHNLILPGYKLYRNDRINKGGGVAIAIRSSIKHTPQSSFPTKLFENTCLSIKINNSEVMFVAAYCPKYTADFLNDLKLLTSTTGDFFVLGDFNAHHPSWNCAEANTAGRLLFNHQLSSNYYIHFPLNSTRIPQNIVYRRSSTIDLLLTNSSFSFTDLETHPFKLNSDHIPITFYINEHVTEDLKVFQDFGRADWAVFRRKLELKMNSSLTINTNLSLSNIDNIVNEFTEILMSVCKETIPQKTVKGNIRRVSSLCKQIISTRNKYRRQFQRCPDPNVRTTLGAIIRELNKLISIHIINDRNEQWANMLSKLPVGNKKFWKLSKFIKGKNKPIGSLEVNNCLITDNSEKVNAIADHFCNAHLTTVHLNGPIDKKVNTFYRSLDQNTIDVADALTNRNELEFFIKKLKNNKAPGLDGIHNIVLKKLPVPALNFLVKVFNFCIQNSCFPKHFKNAKVIPIVKSGKNPKSPSSYRPISLLSCLDKVFEKIIYERIKTITDEKELIHKCQFGFRSQHSTTHQVQRIVNMIRYNKSKRHSTGILFLDIEKAFDSIWHAGLIYKLHKMQLPLYLVKIIKNFLKDRNFVVEIDGCQSNEKSIPAGVPQGSVLSPLLYSLYISDFKSLSGNDVAFYADDSAFVSHGKVSNAIIKRMQRSLNSASKYFTKWKIKINEDKSQAIIFPFNNSRKRIPSRPFTVQNKLIPFSDSIKYLGVTLDRKLLFKNHLDISCSKAIKCGRSLFPLLNRKSKLNIKNKLLLYKMCIRPILTYACPVWQNCAKTHKKRLQVIQNKNLKIIYNLPWRFPTKDLHIMSNQKTIDTVIGEMTHTFKVKCRSSRYEHLRSLI